MTVEFEALSVYNVCFFTLPHSSRAHPPMFAVGSDDSNVNYGGKVQIYEYNENTRWVSLNLPIFMSLFFKNQTSQLVERKC